MPLKWSVSKKQLKEILVNNFFGTPDNVVEHYDLHVFKDGSAELRLNAKGKYHYDNTPAEEYVHYK